MILCLTPNPAIDRTLFIQALRPGEVHRAEKILLAAGGKGLNVARSVKTLGGDPFCMGLVGGNMGNLLADLARQEGLSAHWTPMKSESRSCLILVEPGRDATVVNERGALVEEDECLAFCKDAWEMSVNAGIVCVSGSLPPGFSLETFHAWLAGLVERNKPVWVDTSGPALNTALQVKGLNLKVNAVELSEALGTEISDEKQASNVGRQLVAQGIPSVAVTLGKVGAVLVSAAGAWFAPSPRIDIVSSVGSGDAFLGGLTFALAESLQPELALCTGVAAGAANALHFGGGIFSKRDFDELHAQVKAVALS